MPTIRRFASRSAVYELNYVVVWATYYKRNVLVGDVVTRLKEIIQEVCAEVDVTINELEIEADRVTLFMSTPPNIPPHHIVNRSKFHSSQRIRNEYPALRKRIPSLWNRAYYCATLGEFDETKANEFCLQQKKPYR